MHQPGSSAATGPLPRLPSRYRSIRLLGSGGMASVWCARDTVLGRRVAVKLLSEALSGDPQARRRFLSEARAAARLSGHPHVVTIFDVGDHEQCPYIVMEHLAGGTVADAIRLRAHSREEALCWIEQAAAALDHAHAHGIVHRDVKPANMLLGSDRLLRLGDFGIASLGLEQTLPSGAAIYATAAYISPEQALGRTATPASDRYALAVCAFELLTGERPYGAATATEQARAHVEQPPPRASWRAPQLPEAIDEVLARGMAKAAGERWQTAGELARALRDALEPGAEGRSRARAGARVRFDALPASAGPQRPEARPASAVLDSEARPAFARRHSEAPSASGRRRPGARGRRRALAAAAIALASLAAGIAVGSRHGGPAGASTPTGGRLRAANPAKLRAHRHAQAALRRPRRRVQPAPSAVALEAEGHQLMLDGEYAQALPVLREAVRRADPSSLTYAYALFDLGRTLRLDGQPAAAIPILERRLQIPNQPEVVAYELALAREEAAQQPAVSGQQAVVQQPPAPRRPPGRGSGRRRARRARARAGQQTDIALS